MDDSAWIGLIGALGGVLVTSIVGLITIVIRHTWEDSARREDRRLRLTESQADRRRDAYTHFLVAVDAVADYVLIQPPAGDNKPVSREQAFERLRQLRSGGESHFAKYAEAHIEALLVSGPDVSALLSAFDEWASDQFVAAVTADDPADAGAFLELDSERRPLIEAMRAEQEADLAAP